AAAVAARDPQRARRFAAKQRVPAVHDTYQALLADSELDAVYNPLPNGLHARWTIAALEAGKHVLCEKPFTSNAPEAEAVAEAARSAGLVVMEAFHYRYHPLAERMRSIAQGGELGPLRHLEAWMCFPLPRFSDIRYRYDLGGGALMDAGCYAVHMLRLLGGGEPEVLSAGAKLRTQDVDRAMAAELRFPSGATARLTCSMWSSSLLRFGARVTGDAGELRVLNPIAPHIFHRLTVRAGGRRRTERLRGRPTYEYQLEAFCDAVLRGRATLTPPDDSIANMRVIDSIYQAAGLKLRGT
ncbi:MAG TPA: Gfo/Idh/MocA family oxidoreductase, partial [Acidimicrobiales bacterium]|nr:Gfo/Idh/MocA family oxidoreductase [Acidimicrobiales bacterium]